MITLNKLNGKAHRSYMELFCLSTDAKPVNTYKNMIIGNGSVLYEIDTSKGYVYNEDTASWEQIDSGSAEIEELKQRLNEIDEKVDEIELFKFPNATIVGTPHIDNGQVSEFSADDYLQFPFVVDFRDRPFEINFAFTTGDNVTTHQTLIDSKFGVAFSIDSRKFMMLASTNGTAWDVSITSAANTVNPNTTYYVRLSWDGEVYEMEHSLDNETFVSDGTVESSSQPAPKTIIIGVGSADTATPFPFYGSINLNRASLTIADIIVWQGMDDVGIASRMDVSMSNIDDAGKEVVSGLAPVQDVQANGVSVVDEDGVANIPIASAYKPGIVQVDGRGLQFVPSAGATYLSLRSATDADIKAGAASYYPPAANSLHSAAFWGLLKAAGINTSSSTSTVGNYAESEKSAVLKMIGIETMTKEEYDLLETKGESTIYLIVEDSDNA